MSGQRSIHIVSMYELFCRGELSNGLASLSPCGPLTIFELPLCLLFWLPFSHIDLSTPLPRSPQPPICPQPFPISFLNLIATSLARISPSLASLCSQLLPQVPSRLWPTLDSLSHPNFPQPLPCASVLTSASPIKVAALNPLYSPEASSSFLTLFNHLS